MASIVNEGVSKKSTWSVGKKVGKEEADKIQANFKPPDHAILHWDGKIIPDDAERLGIIITGHRECIEWKPLAILKIPGGTGLVRAQES